MDAEETVRAYYESLRCGESLPPYFAKTEAIVKFGISEHLTGFEEVSEGLREQTRTTDNWQIESRALHVIEREEYAWFSDTIFMAWTDIDRQIRYEFDSRWSGTLEQYGEEWQFVEMHVSTSREL